MSRRVPELGLVAVAVVVACSVPVDDSVIEPGTASAVGPEDLELTIARGASRFDWRARLTNRGAATILIVAPGDGSTDGRRTPIVKWIVETGAGQPVGGGSAGWCGNMNPLESKELLVLEPGESASFDHWIHSPHLPDAGTYYVSLEYTNEPRMGWDEDPTGPEESVARKAVRGSTACSVVSNRVRVVGE